MRFRIDTAIFRSAIEIASHATTVSPLTPILENILIDAQFQRLVLIGNNLEIAIECAITEGVDIESEGKFTISSRFITSYLALVQEKEITIEQENDGSLRFQTKTSATKYKGVPADKFPVIPQTNVINSATILSGDLKRAIEKTIFSTADGAIRPMLAGVYLQVNEKETIFASTDSFRLSEFRVLSGGKSATNISIIIPEKTALELARIINDENTPITLGIGENQLLVQYNHIRLSSRLLSGKFPDYVGFFPTEYNTKAVMLRTECVNAIKQVNLLARNNSSNMCARFHHNGQIEFTSGDTELGNSMIMIPASVEGQEEIIKFNANYMLEALGVMREDHISIEFRSPLTPIILHGVASEEKKYSYRHLIMPLKI